MSVNDSHPGRSLGLSIRNLFRSSSRSSSPTSRRRLSRASLLFRRSRGRSILARKYYFPLPVLRFMEQAFILSSSARLPLRTILHHHLESPWARTSNSTRRPWLASQKPLRVRLRGTHSIYVNGIRAISTVNSTFWTTPNIASPSRDCRPS